jgi:hypothetical protein
MQTSRKVVIAGGTGLIGQRLAIALHHAGYSLTVLTRNPLKANAIFPFPVHLQAWNGMDPEPLVHTFEGAKAVVNLAGETIASYWTKARKGVLLSSRVNPTKAIVEAIRSCTAKPEVLVQASAIGYYPYNCSMPLAEDGPMGQGFLSQLVARWEAVAAGVGGHSRLVLLRTGVVLASKGGFLEQLVKPINLYVGGWFGDGRQSIPWIHIDDHVGAVQFLIENDSLHGPFNLVSPNPVALKSLTRQVARLLGKPAWFGIPAFALRLLLKDMANEVLLANQIIVPQRLRQSGFTFQHETIDEALSTLLSCKISR